MATEVTAKKREEYEKDYKAAADPKTGKMTRQYLQSVMKKLGNTEKEISDILSEVIAEGQEELSLDEFINFKQGHQSLQEMELRKAFNFFDKDKNGYLDKVELLAILKADINGENNVSEEDLMQEVENLMKEVDADNDERVDYEEFVKMMTQ